MIEETDMGATDARTGEGVEETAVDGRSQPEPDPNQEKTAGGNTQDPPQPDPSKGKVGKKSAIEKPKNDPPKTDPPKPKRVRVICEGTLGPRLLETGTVTEDPDYVALLDVKGQKKVELVK